MERRTFLSLALTCSTALAFGNMEEFVPARVGTYKAPLMIKTLLGKLNTVQDHVGYVQFNIISFDDMLKVASHCKVPLSPQEVGYIETIFYSDPRRYGFFWRANGSSFNERDFKKRFDLHQKIGSFSTYGCRY
jgi:zinc D-Ala-D-Ala carboxypeptidase